IKADELNQALAMEARRYPGQEQAVIRYFRENPQALAQLRAPLYEDKVVDFILEMAQVTDRTVTREELEAEPEDEAAKPKKAPAKKAAPKKAASKAAAAKDGESEAKAAAPK